jgi:hypothetical protein
MKRVRWPSNRAAMYLHVQSSQAVHLSDDRMRDGKNVAHVAG